jgi:hypothetical protein
MIEIAPLSWFNLIVGAGKTVFFKSFRDDFAIASYYPLNVGSPINNLWIEFYDN